MSVGLADTLAPTLAHKPDLRVLSLHSKHCHLEIEAALKKRVRQMDPQARWLCQLAVGFLVCMEVLEMMYFAIFPCCFVT